MEMKMEIDSGNARVVWEKNTQPTILLTAAGMEQESGRAETMAVGKGEMAPNKLPALSKKDRTAPVTDCRSSA